MSFVNLYPNLKSTEETKQTHLLIEESKKNAQINNLYKKIKQDIQHAFLIHHKPSHTIRVQHGRLYHPGLIERIKQNALKRGFNVEYNVSVYKNSTSNVKPNDLENAKLWCTREFSHLLTFSIQKKEDRDTIDNDGYQSAEDWDESFNLKAINVMRERTVEQATERIMANVEKQMKNKGYAEIVVNSFAHYNLGKEVAKNTMTACKEKCWKATYIDRMNPPRFNGRDHIPYHILLVTLH